MMSTNKPQFFTSQLSTSSTSSTISSHSSSTTDFNDLLPDLWQTSSNESNLSNSDIKSSLNLQPPPPQWNLYQPQQQPQQPQNWDLDFKFEETFNSILPPDEDIFDQQHLKQPVNTQLYKTELCASFIKIGICPYGSKCQFAHGDHELKHVQRSPKWRSKPCANWSKYGSCRYGSRCCFKHGV